jgi:hypothetical protein
MFASACEICPDAEYDIEDDGADSTLTCHGYDDKDVYNGEYCKIVSCTWHCAHYDGGDCAYVSLTFMSCDGSGWELDHSFIAECI